MIRKFSTTALLFLTACCLVVPVLAQSMPMLKYASVSATAVPAAATIGGTAKIVVTIAVSPGFHVNSAHPNDPDLIPTVVSTASVPGLIFGTPVYPTSKTINAPSLSQKPLSVYTGTIKIRIGIKVAKSAKPGSYKVPITVSYQGCNASACYPPTSSTVSTTVTVQ
jgi:hypothetical protein